MAFKNLYKDTLDICKKHNVKIEIIDSKTIDSDLGLCAGSFSIFPEPVISIAKLNSEFKEVFCHESCHLDQWLENVPVFFSSVAINNCAHDLLITWLNKERDFSPDVIKLFLGSIVEMELDCERRSIKKIKDYKIHCNRDNYHQNSNAYLLTYYLIGEARNLLSKETSEIIKCAAPDMPRDYCSIDYRNPQEKYMTVLRAALKTVQEKSD